MKFKSGCYDCNLRGIHFEADAVLKQHAIDTGHRVYYDTWEDGPVDWHALMKKARERAERENDEEENEEEGF